MGTDLDNQMEENIDDQDVSVIEEEGEEEEEEYVVEEILNHRINRKGKLEYYLKWKGFTDADNTWEPAENLNCPGLVNVYETERKKKIMNSRNAKELKKGKKRKSTGEGVNGFEKGLTAKEIVGATEEKGKVYFLIKWTDRTEEDELVPASVVNVSIPQMVIAFYEARLAWSTVNTLEDEEEEEEDVDEVGTVADEKKDEATSEKLVEDERKPTDVSEEKKPTDVSEEKSTDVSEEKKPTDVSEEKKVSEKDINTADGEEKLLTTTPPPAENSEIDVT